MFEKHEVKSSVHNINKLKAGDNIQITTHFFPIGTKNSKIYFEDKIDFESGILIVIYSNKKRLKVRDEYDRVVYIPIKNNKLKTEHDQEFFINKLQSLEKCIGDCMTLAITDSKGK